MGKLVNEIVMHIEENLKKKEINTFDFTPIVLDSSTWNKYIREEIISEKINNLFDRKFIPLFTNNNLKEIINYGNNEIVRKRIVQLQKIKYFFKFKDNIAPISSTNILEKEIVYILGNKIDEIVIDKITNFMNNNLEIISGEDLLEGLDIIFPIIKQFTNTKKVESYFTSLPPKLHHKGHDSSKIKLKDLSPENFNNATVKNQKKIIKDNFELKGDKKNKSLINEIDDVIDGVLGDIRVSDKASKIQIFADIANLPVSEISLEMTADEYFYKMEYYAKVIRIVNDFNLDIKDLCNFGLDNIPTLRLERLFQEEYHSQILKDKPRRAEASIHQDRYLCFFSIYWKLIVDSRTKIVLDAISDKFPYELDYELLDY